jgi:tetratricopeptide (TPR) repeat protein
MGFEENAIIPRMFLRFTGALVLICVTALGAVPHPAQSMIVIDEDLRFFTTIAALNVAGFDVELSSQYHPVRAEIRKIAASLDPSLVKKLRDFYNTHKGGAADEDQLAKYISLAVVLSDPPSFKPVAREESLPDDARSVLGFAPLLQEFYQKAAVPKIWAAVGPVYEAEMDRIGPSIRNAIARSDSYLRVSSGGVSSQTMKISVELGAPQNSVNVRNYQDNYYVVLGYASTPKIEEMRHAYLHVRLNNYANAAAVKVQKRSDILALLSGEEGVQRDYATNFENMMAESLVRAVELRIDREAAPSAEEKIRKYYRSGLLLAPYYYEALSTYEAGETPLRSEVATLSAAIDAGKEQTRFQETFHSIPLPEPQPLRAEVPAAPRVDPVLDLLRYAQAVFDKDKPRAREAFEKVLKDYDPNNGKALYGLALIEMDKATNLDEALQYFERTIKSESADPSMKTWSYIYSGHILDFKCNRAAAIENYQKAIETGDDTRDAQKTAKRDLAQPFGGECRQ